MDVETLLQPGTSFSVYFGEGNINNRREHVRAIVDDDQIVIRFWSRRSQYWRYVIHSTGWYEMLLADDRIRNVKSGR